LTTASTGVGAFYRLSGAGDIGQHHANRIVLPNFFDYDYELS